MKPRSLSALLLAIALFAVVTVAPGCRVKVHNTDPIKSVATTPEEQTQAVESMKTFLAEVDKDPAGSWERLSQTLKASTPKMAWTAVIGGMMTVCGPKVSRGTVKFICTDDLPDSPKGRYFVFDIASKFEKADLTERVVLVLENGQWKVAGYFRKKMFPFVGDAKKT